MSDAFAQGRHVKRSLYLILYPGHVKVSLLSTSHSARDYYSLPWGEGGLSTKGPKQGEIWALEGEKSQGFSPLYRVSI